MYCKNCGEELDENMSFCPSCGEKTHEKAEKNVKTIQLRCKECSGIMEVDASRKEVYCPYCGSKEAILDSDEVEVEKLRSTAFKEVEAARLKHEKEFSEKEDRKAAKRAYRKGVLSKVTFVLIFVTAYIAYRSFSEQKLLLVLLAGGMAVLFALSWLNGMQVIGNGKKGAYLLFLLLGLLLFIPFFQVREKAKLPKLSWPTEGLAQHLPDPKAKYGSIQLNTAKVFRVELEETTEEDYHRYVEACIENGYVIDASDGLMYEAYNQEGYGLMVEDHTKTVVITLDAPVEMTEIYWPQSTVASLLPRPASSRGRIASDTSSSLDVYIADTTKEDFDAYVDACMAGGYTVEYKRGTDYFTGKNTEGYPLTLKYSGLDIMRIRIQEPKAETAATAPTSTPEPAMTAKEETTSQAEEISQEETTAASSSGVNPELKAFLDSYEEVMNSYCDFIEKYDDASTVDQIKMAVDYAKMTAKYADMSQKMEQYDEDDLSGADLAYYLEVTNRVNQRLLSIAVQ